MQAFASCGERGLLSGCGAVASLCGGFSGDRAQALGVQASIVAAGGLTSSAYGLSSCSSWALEHWLRSCGPWA